MRKGVAAVPKKTNIATTGTLRSAYLTKEVKAEQASSVPSSISRKMTEGPVRHEHRKGDKAKESSEIAKRANTVRSSLQGSKMD